MYSLNQAMMNIELVKLSNRVRRTSVDVQFRSRQTRTGCISLSKFWVGNSTVAPRKFQTRKGSYLHNIDRYISNYNNFSLFTITCKPTDTEVVTEELSKTRLYIGSISWELDAHQAQAVVRDMCEEYKSSSEEDIKVEVPWMDKKKKKVQKHRGYAFVSFQTEESADTALKGLTGRELEGRELKVKMATAPPPAATAQPTLKTRPGGRQHVKLFVGTLPSEIDSEQLRDMFESCGSVVDAKVVKDNKGVSRGFGFVTMANPVAADKAMSMQGSYLEGRYVHQGQVEWEERRLPIIVNMADSS